MLKAATFAIVAAAGLASAQSQGTGQQCTIQVPPPYNSATACPNLCQTQCSAYQYAAPANSAVTKVDSTPYNCNGVTFYRIRYNNFYDGKVTYGYVPAVYLDCSSPPPPALAVSPSVPLGGTPSPAPAPQGSSEDSADTLLLQRRGTNVQSEDKDTTNSGANGGEPLVSGAVRSGGQMRTCAVPKTTYTYNSRTCERKVQINGGSVVVDMGRDIVYSDACGTEYLYVEYMLMGGSTGHGLVPYADLQC